MPDIREVVPTGRVFLLDMTKEEASALLWAAEEGDIPEIDLHGMKVMEVRHALETFLHHTYLQGESVARIVHGRGDGVLRQEVHKVLSQTDFIDQFQDATHPALSGAVTVALFCPLK